MKKQWLILSLMIVLGHPWTCLGARGQVEVKTLNLVPAGEPSPALSIRLVPRHSELKSGNAALHYNAAIGFQPQVDEDAEKAIDRWRDLPVAQWPMDEVTEQMESFANALRYVRLGTYCRTCDWGQPIEDGYDLSMLPLHDFRLMAKLMSVRTRLALEQGDHDLALASMQDSLVMGMNMGKGAMMVQSLVGISMARLSLLGIDTWCQTPGAPNLYWALTMLPNPPVTAYDAYDYEREMILNTFPRLRDIEDKVFTVDEVKDLVREIVTHDFLNMTTQEQAPPAWTGLVSTAWVMHQYQDAKAWLLGQSWSEARIDALPAAQAVLIYQWQQYQRLFDNSIKGMFLPFAQGAPMVQAAQEELYQVNGGGTKINFFMMYLPAMTRIHELQTRLARNVELYRVIEALRWYAAEHQGKLPLSLDQIDFIPIPVDPISGQAFVYECSDGIHARLEAPPYWEDEFRRPVYELIMKQ